jgi:hypothetical protein
MAEAPQGFPFGFGLLPDGSYRFWLPTRFVLARTALRGRDWPPYRLRLARLRCLYWTARGHETEICGRCGGRVRLVFHVPDAIWTAVTGYTRALDGEAAPGVLCPACVTELYDRSPDRISFLRWTCATDDSVMRDARSGGKQQ